MIAKEGRIILIPLLFITFPIGVYAHASNNISLIVLYAILGLLFLFFVLFLLWYLGQINTAPLGQERGGGTPLTRGFISMPCGFKFGFKYLIPVDLNI